jgi:hypothetical protein
MTPRAASWLTSNSPNPTCLRVTPELADPLGTLEVREHEDVEQLGAECRAEGVQALA